MHTYKTTKIVSAALVGLLLSACGGGDNSPIKDLSSNNSNSIQSNTSNSSAASSVDTTSAKKIGSGTADTFQEGIIGVTNNKKDLSAGGSTTLSVYIVSSTNTPVVSSTTVSFISDCIAAGKAQLTDASGALTTSASTINGRATITYKATGCVDTDTLIASATIDGVIKNAQVDLTIETATVGSIEFVDATPAQIGLKGSGGQETSTIRFRVVDGSGSPVENTDVNFTMSTTSGGLSLTPVTGKSNSDGYVSTTINAGTVTSVVSVTATIVDKNISTSSNTLTVSTGVPVQRNTSLSIETFNPPAWETDGVEVKVTMRMADDFGNPVLDNTGVTFWTEGGAIGSNCLTKNGSCEVKWISQDFRPNNGRVTILAFATGNETFIDSNTNGRYDLNESFSDLGEAFRDDNENNLYDFPEELFVDLTDKSNGNAPNGSYELNGDGVYSGTLCYLENSSICTREKITVRKSAIIAMSSWVGKFSLFTDQMCTVASNGFLAASSPTLYVLAEDRNGNSLPNGTKLTAENATGLTAKLDATIPNTSEPGCFPILLTGSSGSTGRFTVQSKTAKNEISTATYDITFN